MKKYKPDNYTKQQSEFVKDDINKPRMSLIEPEFLTDLAKVLTAGAAKYDVDNWKLIKSEEIYRYKDALLRHVMAYQSGEMLDPETNLPHLSHAAANLMFLHHLEGETNHKSS